MRRHPGFSLWIASAATLALVGCGSRTDNGAAATTVTTAATVATAPTAAPTTASTPGSVEAPSSLQFSADLVAGGTVDFRQYAGQTLALWFWAPT